MKTPKKVNAIRDQLKHIKPRVSKAWYDQNVQSLLAVSFNLHSLSYAQMTKERKVRKLFFSNNDCKTNNVILYWKLGFNMEQFNGVWFYKFSVKLWPPKGLPACKKYCWKGNFIMPISPLLIIQLNIYFIVEYSFHSLMFMSGKNFQQWCQETLTFPTNSIHLSFRLT